MDDQEARTALREMILNRGWFIHQTILALREEGMNSFLERLLLAHEIRAEYFRCPRCKAKVLEPCHDMGDQFHSARMRKWTEMDGLIREVASAVESVWVQKEFV